MENYSIVEYSSIYKNDWDKFVEIGEINSFLFKRDFIEYHKNRFIDNSLIIYLDEKIIAIFPANLDENKSINSHLGLSYGGILFEPKTTLEKRKQVFFVVLKYLYERKINEINLKQIPLFFLDQIYNTKILEIIDAKLIRSDIHSYIPKLSYCKPNNDRFKYIRKASRKNFKIVQSNHFDIFWDKLLIPNLKNRHNVSPVHSIEEIILLSKNFPENIIFTGCYQNDILRAGNVIFLNDDIAHTQYISGDENRKDGSLDFLMHQTILKFNKTKKFSFGSSSEKNGTKVNKGLLYWKDSFKSLRSSQNFYNIKTINYKNLSKKIK